MDRGGHMVKRDARCFLPMRDGGLQSNFNVCVCDSNNA